MLAPISWRFLPCKYKLPLEGLSASKDGPYVTGPIACAARVMPAIINLPNIPSPPRTLAYRIPPARCQMGRYEICDREVSLDLDLD